MLVSEQKCNSCQEYLVTLRALASRGKQQQAVTTPTKRTDASSHVNFRYLSKPEKAECFCSTRAKEAVKEADGKKLNY